MEFNKVLKGKAGEEFPFSEKINEKGYLYNISVNWNDKECIVSIVNSGCIIVFEGGDTIDLDIKPETLFPKKGQLSESDLLKILALSESSNLEGEFHSREEMNKIYEMYLKETGNRDLRRESKLF